LKRNKNIIAKKPGKDLNILGFLGNGFRILRNIENIFIIARGIGIAPFKALIEDILLKNKSKVLLFFSVKEEKLMLLIDDLKNLDLDIYKYIGFSKNKENSKAVKDFYKFTKKKYFNCSGKSPPVKAGMRANSR